MGNKYSLYNGRGAIDEFAAYYAKNHPYLAWDKISHGALKTNCKGLCTLKLGGIKGNSVRGLYKLGYRYCCRCELYFKGKDGVNFCECCGMALRKKSRQGQKLQEW